MPKVFNWFKDSIDAHLKKRRMEQRGLVGSRKRRTDSPLLDAAEHSKVLGLFYACRVVGDMYFDAYSAFIAAGKCSVGIGTASA